MNTPQLTGNRIQFRVSVEPELYYQLNNARDVNVPLTRYAADILADAIGYQKIEK